ncbi:TolC family protein [Pectobacterium cacticida]|uniref:TolC family protein n=1 Tax=Pectobacterium cacticida TaxID=69221 RepID=UPI00222141D3|nr:TolC family protein [Pectobacterium cacticida]UYX05728.1 TolC family protein [Pectobacterium cacticida]
MTLSKCVALRACLAMLLWWPAAIFAADLSLEQALQAAERYSADLSANQHQINALQNMADAATQLPDPKLKFGVENLPLGGNNGRRLSREGMTMQRIGIMQTYVSSRKRDSKAQAIRVAANVRQSNSDTIRARLQRETAQAWLDLALLRQTLNEVTALVAESQRQIAVQKARVAAGSEASNVLDARLTLATMQDKQTDVERDAHIAHARLVQLTGMADIKISGKLPSIERLPASPDELSHAIHRHPEMQQAQREAELAQARSAQSAAAAIPNVDVEVYYAKRGDDYDDMAGMMVTVDLPLFKSRRQDKDYAADVSRNMEARDKVLLIEREHRAQLDALIAQYQAARSRWQRLNHEILPLQQQRIKLIQAQYQSGSSTLSAVLNARRALLESRIAVQDTTREMAQYWAAIHYLTPQGSPAR